MTKITDKTKIKILIVEDEPVLIDVLKDKLIREDFAVLVAKNGEEGLALSIKNHPDIILLDIIMPKMNGVDMLIKLREDAWGKNVPVLLLTNNGNPEHMRKTLKFNAIDYLIKSDWKLEEIINKIKETLNI